MNEARAETRSLLLRETEFIEKNKKKWARFEKIAQQKTADPDELRILFVEITEDLSFARTYYPKRSVRVYLNSLAQKVFNKLYRQKKDKKSRIADFILRSLPLEMFKARRIFFFCALVLIISSAIGCVSSFIDEDFARIILGDNYVELTEGFIEAGDPLAIYKQERETEMFFMLITNNLKVDLICFFSGIFFSLGAVFILIQNGVMLGAFQYWFYNKGLFLFSFLGIWIHGTLEMAGAVLATTAGVVMGNGLLFPGTLSRLQSLQLSAKRGVKILLGVIPLTVTAGFLEGFVTRHAREMSILSKSSIIYVSFLIVYSYFVVYPCIVGGRIKFKNKKFDVYRFILMIIFPPYFIVEYIAARKVAEREDFVQQPEYYGIKPLEYFKPRNIGDTFLDTFTFYTRFFKNFGKTILFICLPLSFFYMKSLYNESYDAEYTLEWFENIAIAFSTGFENTFIEWKFFFMSCGIFSIAVAAVNFSLEYTRNESKIRSYWTEWFRTMPLLILKTFPIIALVYWLIRTTGFFFIPIGAILGAFIMFTPYAFAFYRKKPFKGLGSALKFGAKHWGINTALLIVLSIVVALFSVLLIIPLKLLFINGIVEWHAVAESDAYEVIINMCDGLLYYCTALFIIPFLFIGVGFQFMSTVEINEGVGLREGLKKFGKSNRIYETREEGFF